MLPFFSAAQQPSLCAKENGSGKVPHGEPQFFGYMVPSENCFRNYKIGRPTQSVASAPAVLTKLRADRERERCPSGAIWSLCLSWLGFRLPCCIYMKDSNIQPTSWLKRKLMPIRIFGCKIFSVAPLHAPAGKAYVSLWMQTEHMQPGESVPRFLSTSVHSST